MCVYPRPSSEPSGLLSRSWSWPILKRNEDALEHVRRGSVWFGEGTRSRDSCPFLFDFVFELLLNMLQYHNKMLLPRILMYCNWNSTVCTDFLFFMYLCWRCLLWICIHCADSRFALFFHSHFLSALRLALLWALRMRHMRKWNQIPFACALNSISCTFVLHQASHKIDFLCSGRAATPQSQHIPSSAAILDCRKLGALSGSAVNVAMRRSQSLLHTHAHAHTRTLTLASKNENAFSLRSSWLRRRRWQRVCCCCCCWRRVAGYR